MTDIATFDRLPPEAASEMLRACCGATRWVEGMLGRRPFVSILSLLAAADDVWRLMGPADWREAFEHHPRLGDSSGVAAQGRRARTWSSDEQAGMADAGADERAVLAAANAAYEARFGYICIICATGMGVAEIAMLTEERLQHEPDEELPVAAEEQRKITRLRLLKLFHDPEAGASR